MKTILLTGFEPFGGDATNPSHDVALALAGRTILGRRIVGRTLPCAFGESARQLAALIRRHDPELVVCLGLAGNRTEITVERIAINLDDARIADNEGRQPVDRPIVRGGPAAYWSTLPVKAMVAELNRQGMPASVSQTAGTFVCNHVFYALMHRLRRHPRCRAGFIHLPWSAKAAESRGGGLTSEKLTDAIELAVRVALRRRRDVRRTGGAVA